VSLLTRAYGCESVRPALCCSMRSWSSKNLRKKLILAGWRWPFLLSGISFWTGPAERREQVYLIGNIVSWWICIESVRPALCCSMRSWSSKNLRKKLILAGWRGSFLDSHPYASGPINWPFLLSGISFWTGPAERREQVYL
jgi:dolichyl-phosphate-mannose--protein O-mannosyl transferase